MTYVRSDLNYLIKFGIFCLLLFLYFLFFNIFVLNFIFIGIFPPRNISKPKIKFDNCIDSFEFCVMAEYITVNPMFVYSFDKYCISVLSVAVIWTKSYTHRSSMIILPFYSQSPQLFNVYSAWLCICTSIKANTYTIVVCDWCNSHSTQTALYLNDI